MSRPKQKTGKGQVFNQVFQAPKNRTSHKHSSNSGGGDDGGGGKAGLVR